MKRRESLVFKSLCAITDFSELCVDGWRISIPVLLTLTCAWGFSLKAFVLTDNVFGTIPMCLAVLTMFVFFLTVYRRTRRE